jgi:hypothetical protein
VGPLCRKSAPLPCTCRSAPPLLLSVLAPLCPASLLEKKTTHQARARLSLTGQQKRQRKGEGEGRRDCSLLPCVLVFSVRFLCPPFVVASLTAVVL